MRRQECRHFKSKTLNHRSAYDREKEREKERERERGTAKWRRKGQ